MDACGHPNMKTPWWKLVPERRIDKIVGASVLLVAALIWLAMGHPWVALAFCATGIAKFVELYRTRSAPDGSNPQE